MFKIVNTFKNPGNPVNAQRGMPSPGTGAQQTNPARRQPGDVPWFANVDYQGTDTWPSNAADGYGNPQFPVDAQRGQPAPQGPGQARPKGSVRSAPMDGRQQYRETREFSRGMQRYAPITPILVQNANPGDWVPHKPTVVPRYPLGQYINNTIFFANQVIPTTIPLAGLQTKDAIDALLSTFQVTGEYESV